MYRKTFFFLKKCNTQLNFFLEVVMVGTKVGRDLATEGWQPDHPVVCIPGFASSALYVKKGLKKWEGKRIWLDINNLLGSKVSQLSNKLQSKKSEFSVCDLF